MKTKSNIYLWLTENVSFDIANHSQSYYNSKIIYIKYKRMHVYDNTILFSDTYKNIDETFHFELKLILAIDNEIRKKKFQWMYFKKINKIWKKNIEWISKIYWKNIEKGTIK